MLKKKAVSHSPNENSKSKGSAPPKRAQAKGQNLPAISSTSAKAVGKTAGQKPKAASTTTPKAVQPPTTRNHRAPAMVAAKGHTVSKAVRAPQFDRFSILMTELADSRLSRSDAEIAFMGLYYAAPLELE